MTPLRGLAALRVRFLLLFVLVLAPLLGTTLYHAQQRFELAREMGQASVTRLAQLVAMQHRFVIDGTRQLLGAISAMPALASGACNDYLASVLAQHEELHGLRVTDATGALRCGAGHVRTANVAGQGWFERVVRGGASLAGEYRLGPTSGRPEVVVAQVLPGPASAVLSAAVDLDRFGLLLIGDGLPAGSAVAAWDTSGDALVKPARDARWEVRPAGRLAADPAPDSGGIQTEPDGTRRFAAVADAGHLGTEGFRVQVAVPYDSVMGPAGRAYRATLAGLLLSLAAAIALAVVGVHLLVLAPIDRLSRAATALAGGDLTARARVSNRHGELGALGTTFDTMAAALETRHAQLANALGSVRRELAERERLENALKASEKRYHLLFDNAPLGYQSLDEHGNFVEVNAAWLEFFGCSRSEVIGRNFAEFLAPEYRPLFAERFPVFKRVGRVDGVEYEVVRGDGTHALLSFNGRIAHDHQGVQHTHSVFRDITEQRRAQSALVESETRFRHAIADAPFPVVMFAEDGDILKVNTAWTDLSGYAAEQIPTVAAWAQLAYGPRAPEMLERIRAATAAKVPTVNRDYAIRTASGETRIWTFASAPIGHLPDGRRVMLSMAKDMTESHALEQALREKEERYRTLVELSPDATLVHTDGRIVFANQAAARLWAVDRPEALLGAALLDLLHPDSRDIARACIQQLHDGAGVADPIEEHIQRADGTAVPAEVLAARIEFEGRPAVLVIARDLSERYRAAETLRDREAELRQAQKMEAMGRLAGGVAHDFNNMLTAILGYSDHLLERLDKDSALRTAADEIRQAGERATALTRQLLAFSRKQALKPEVCDLNAIVTGVERMLRRVIGEHVQLATMPCAEPARIQADRGQIEQVILNLVVNARDALGQGGRIVIAVNRADAEAPRANTYGEIAPGPHVVLRVADSGCGMSEEVRSHLFEPFFTTKEADKGTGLGLSTVYGIVRQSGGHIHVDTQPGRGTTFSICLPVAQPGAVAEPAQKQVEGPTQARTVLVAEDDDGVRSLMRLILQQQGYVVLEARDGHEAEAIGLSLFQPLHLLITDVVMPEASGPAVAEHLTAIFPGMRVLYVSGYLDETTAAHGMPQHAGVFLQKPFTPDELLEKVRATLDADALML
jgi:PAS domain S-box-containing protein